MDKIISFRDYIKTLNEANSTDINDTETKDEKPTETEKTSDSEKPKKEKVDNSDKITNDYIYTARFSPLADDSNEDDKMKSLNVKCSMLRATLDSMLNTFAKVSTASNTNQENIGVPIKILRTSIEGITNDFKKWSDETLVAYKKKYKENKDTMSSLNSGFSDKEEADRVAKNVNESYYDGITEGIKDFLDKFSEKVVPTGNIFKSTNNFVMGKNKYNANSILDTMKGKSYSNTEKGSNLNIYALKNDKIFDDAEKDFINRGRVIIGRNKNEVEKILDTAQSKINNYNNYSDYVKNTSAYISEVESYLSSAWAKIRSMSSLLNTVLSDYQSTVNEVKREFMKQFFSSEDELHSHNTKVTLKSKTDAFETSEKQKREEAEKNAKKEAEKNYKSEVDKAKEEIEKYKRDRADKKEAEKARRKFNATVKDDETNDSYEKIFMDQVEDVVKKYDSTDKLEQVIEDFKNGNVSFKDEEGKEVPKTVVARLLYTAYTFNLLHPDRKDGIGLSSSIEDYADEVWDDFSAKNPDNDTLINSLTKDISIKEKAPEKNSSEILSFFSRMFKNSKLSGNKTISSLLKNIINSKAVQGARSAVENIRNKASNDNQKTGTNGAVKFAKDFDTPNQNIFDYALQKARNNK